VAGNSLADKLPPQSLEAEESVLGAMLLDKEAVIRAGELLQSEDFYREAHRKLFDCMLHLSERGEPVDLVTVTEELRRREDLETVGGAAYVGRLANTVPTAANVAHYARIVEERAVLRRLLEAATAIARSVYAGAEDVDTILDQAEQLVFAVSRGVRSHRHVSIREVLVQLFERIEYLYENKGRAIGVPTGFPKLDELTAGLQPSELIILAARPGMGKTTLALNIAAGAALNHQVPAAVFSLEMSRNEVAQRLLCSEAGVNGHRLRTGYLREDDWPKLSRALGRLSEAPIFIDDTPGISVMELRARARRLRSDHAIGLVVVDYLQLMRTGGRTENRQQEIADITRALKALARELDVPVMALSQLSRAVEQRENRRPQLSDLRESGAIEQDADVVAFIYYGPESEQEPGRDAAEIIVAKQRNGPVGSANLVFLKDISRFFPLETRHKPPEA